MPRLPPSVNAALTTAARYASMIPWWGWVGAGSLLVLGVHVGEAAAAEIKPGLPGTKPPSLPPKPPGNPPLVMLGDSGPWVAYLRSLLSLPPGSSFDAATDAAVKKFQTSKKLEVDGKVGTNTWKALGVTATSAPPTPKPPPPGSGAPPPDFLGGAAGNIDLADDIPSRDQQILAAVIAGDVDHQWTPIQWSGPDGRVVKMDVSRRALAITDGAGGRLIVNASFKTAQKIADVLGAAMLTTRMADKIQELADVSISPPLSHPWFSGPGGDGSMGKTARMFDQSALIDSKIEDNGQILVSNEGKDWVLTRRFWPFPAGTNSTSSGEGAPGSPHNSANFGWYGGPGAGSVSPGGAKVVQSIGLMHDKSHSDYSQLLRFIRKNSLTIDGTPVDLEVALADPETSALLQDEGGTLPGIKHPDLEGVV